VTFSISSFDLSLHVPGLHDLVATTRLEDVGERKILLHAWWSMTRRKKLLDDGQTWTLIYWSYVHRRSGTDLMTATNSYSSLITCLEPSGPLVIFVAWSITHWGTRIPTIASCCRSAPSSTMASSWSGTGTAGAPAAPTTWSQLRSAAETAGRGLPRHRPWSAPTCHRHRHRPRTSRARPRRRPW
jgi:hypothetical protein